MNDHNRWLLWICIDFSAVRECWLVYVTVLYWVVGPLMLSSGSTHVHMSVFMGLSLWYSYKQHYTELLFLLKAMLTFLIVLLVQWWGAEFYSFLNPGDNLCTIFSVIYY